MTSRSGRVPLRAGENDARVHLQRKFIKVIRLHSSRVNTSKSDLGRIKKEMLCSKGKQKPQNKNLTRWQRPANPVASLATKKRHVRKLTLSDTHDDIQQLQGTQENLLCAIYRTKRSAGQLPWPVPPCSPLTLLLNFRLDARVRNKCVSIISATLDFNLNESCRRGKLPTSLFQKHTYTYCFHYRSLVDVGLGTTSEFALGVM